MAMMKNQVNAQLLLTIGAVGGLLLLVSAIAVDGWYKSTEQEIVASNWEKYPNTWLNGIREREQANLAASGPVDNGKRTAMPIAQAMQYVVDHGGQLPTTQPAK